MPKKHHKSKKAYSLCWKNLNYRMKMAMLAIYLSFLGEMICSAGAFLDCELERAI